MFEMSQIVIITLALVESWAVHEMAKLGHRAQAKTIDEVMAFALPTLYLIVVAFLVLAGFRHWILAIVVVSVGIFLLVAASYAYYQSVLAFRQEHYNNVIQKSCAVWMTMRTQRR